VFCGTAAGLESARRQHYYAGPGNEFWSMLHQSGLVAERLRPQEDARILDFGLGLTDLPKGRRRL
jgi:TDG/mug DNA glycosylase family protein